MQVSEGQGNRLLQIKKRLPQAGRRFISMI